MALLESSALASSLSVHASSPSSSRQLPPSQGLQKGKVLSSLIPPHRHETSLSIPAVRNPVLAPNSLELFDELTGKNRLRGQGHHTSPITAHRASVTHTRMAYDSHPQRQPSSTGANQRQPSTSGASQRQAGTGGSNQRQAPGAAGSDSGGSELRASLTTAPQSSADVDKRRPGAEARRGADSSPPREAHVYRKVWDFPGKSQEQEKFQEKLQQDKLQEKFPPAAASAAAALVQWRSVPITIHGCVSEEDAAWVQQQVSKIDGVQNVFVQGCKEGGLRGGSVQLQLEVDPSVKLPALVDAVHSLEERLLALPFKTHSWEWKGHNISYAVAGCGKPVILVHGFGGSAGHFRNLIAHLADEHQVYAVDLLGFGNSDKPADVAYGPELWADIINDFAQEFAQEPPVLVGNSIGSLTALTAAKQMVKASNSVRGLVLLNVAGAMNRKGLMQDDILLRALSPIFIGIEYLLQRPRVASFLFERFRSRANVRKILSQQVYRNSAAVDDRLLDILYEPSQDEGALDVFVRVFTGDPGPRPEELVQHLDEVPMLVLWGDADPWTPINGKVAQLFRSLEAERDDVFLVPLPDVGHCPHDDRPELAASHILPWLSSLGSSEL